MAARCKPKFFHPIYITAAQISQMVVGVIVTVYGCYLLWLSPTKIGSSTCWLTPDNNAAPLVMYGSYLFLFLEFFWKRYDAEPIQKASSLSYSTTNGGITMNGHVTTNRTNETYAPKIKKEHLATQYLAPPRCRIYKIYSHWVQVNSNN
jgi:GNS1/SUR4 family